MSSRKEREEFKKWAQEMGLPTLSEEGLTTILRGPARDFFVNFLMKRVRSDSYIATMRANLYLDQKFGPQSSERLHANETQKEIDKSVNDTLFAEKRKKLHQLEEECQAVTKEIEKTREILELTKHNPYVEDFGKVLELSSSFAHRIHATEKIMQEIRRSSLSRASLLAANSEQDTASKSEDCEAKMLALSKAAHRAFQLVILRHFDPPEEQAAIRYSAPLSAEDFNSLVMDVIDCMNSVQYVHDWLEKERMNYMELCGKVKQDLEEGEHFSIKDKTDDLVNKWSSMHIDLHEKNHQREKLLQETRLKLEQLLEALKASHAYESVGEEGFNSIILKAKMEGLIKRCRQHSRKLGQHVENLFPNVSMDLDLDENNLHFWEEPGRSSSFDENEAVLDDDRGVWVDTLDTVEMMQEVSQVLKKTWPKQKESFTTLLGVREVSNQLPTTMLKTQECLKLTAPKAINDTIFRNPEPKPPGQTESGQAVHRISQANRNFGTASVNDSNISVGSDVTRNSANSSFGAESGRGSTSSMQDITDLVKRVQNLAK